MTFPACISLEGRESRRRSEGELADLSPVLQVLAGVDGNTWKEEKARAYEIEGPVYADARYTTLST
jgi:hypothetical protein